MTKPNQQIRLVRLVRNVPSVVLHAMEARDRIIGLIPTQITIKSRAYGDRDTAQRLRTAGSE